METRFQFGPRGKLPAADVHWYEGEAKPPAEIARELPMNGLQGASQRHLKEGQPAMGLRIQNNVEAFNAHRQLNTTALKAVLVCSSCGRVDTFEDPALEAAIEALSARVGYRVAEHDVVLRGACDSCA